MTEIKEMCLKIYENLVWIYDEHELNRKIILNPNID